MKSFVLTKNELEIMTLLWQKERALSRSEIIELSPNRSWKQSSIHILLNKMLDKGALEVKGFVRTGKTYGRVYSPSVTQDEYAVMQIMNSTSYKESKSSTSLAIFSALLKDDIDDSLIDELQKMIDERRQEFQK